MPETENVKKTKKRKDSILTTGFAFLVLFPMMYLMLPTVIFLFLAMLPLISLHRSFGPRLLRLCQNCARIVMPGNEIHYQILITREFAFYLWHQTF